MPATFTSAGTWTALSTDLTPYRQGAQTSTANGQATNNVPTNINIAYADLRTVPEEVFQFIDLIQNGYSTGAAPNISRLHFWAAATLLRNWLNALFDSQTLATPTSLAPQLRT